jgi:hypothetical protein
VIIRGAPAVARAAAPASEPAAEDNALADLAPTTAPATTQPKLPTPTADYEVYDWAVFVAEPLAPRANAVAAIKSTLPSFVVSRRPDSEPDERMQPMPIGIIRVTGGKSPSPKFDVLLTIKNGEFQGHWPKSESRNNRLLWSNLVADDAKPSLSQVDPKHWFNKLRDGESKYLSAQRDSRGERFLAYDAEPAITMPLKVEAAGQNGYRVSNTGSADVLNLEFYKGRDDGWHNAFVTTLPASSAAKAHPTSKPADDGQPRLAVGDSLTLTIENLGGGGATNNRTTKLGSNRALSVPMVGNVEIAGKTVEEAEQAITKKYADANIVVSKITLTIQGKQSAPAAAPTTGPAGPASEIPLSTSAVKDPKQLLDAWKERLADAGLPPTDNETFLDILSKYAIDSGRLTAVYRLDRKQMDDLLPLEIVPQPAKMARVGLVIVRNIDPQINEEITKLIKQLGDDDWATREEAQKKLATFGRAAKSALEKAAKEKDMEVVWRAEAVLRTIDPQKFQVPQ